MPNHVRPARPRFLRLVVPFLRSKDGRRARWLLVALVAELLTLTILNVTASYVNRDVMTALAGRHSGEFFLKAGLWLGVFFLLTLVALFYRFTEEYLGLVWRKRMTLQLIGKYAAERRYYAINQTQQVDNPDQRISEDVRTFTVNTLSLLLIILNSSISLIAFIGVLWAITPWLVLAAVGYAAVWTWLTLLVGRRLVRLNNRQFRVEADLRIDLARARDHAEPLALQDSGPGLSRLLRLRLKRAVRNLRSIIGVNRRLNFFVNSFGYLTQVIPVMIVAPAFIRGEVEFGVVTQAAIAFAAVLNSISVAITNFGQISSLAAVVERLSGLMEALERPHANAKDAPEIVEEPDRWACEHVTLRVGGDRRPPIADLNFDHPGGKRMLVLGANGIGKTDLFNATAGVRAFGTGKIVRPAGAAFLPQRPYFLPGSLRDVVTDFGELKISDEAICDVLRRVGFAPICTGEPELSEPADWSERLPASDLQALAVGRLLLRKPRWAFLNGVASSFAPALRDEVYRMFDDAAITYVTFADDAEFAQFHDRVLHIQDGRWWIEER